MMQAIKALVCLVLLALSPFVLLQGLANARLAPTVISWNGFWQADLAGSFLVTDQSNGQLELTVSATGLELARDALAREPFATDALFLNAVDFRSQGQKAELERLLALGVGLDKRNRQLGVLQLEQAAVEGDFSQTFAVIDRLAVTNPRFLPDFIRPMTALVEQDAAIPVLRDALRQDPRWGPAFWNAMPQTADGVTNLYRLRRMVNLGTSQETDQRLMAALAAQRRYDLVFDFWDELGIADTGDNTGDRTAFFPSQDFQPIGWQATTARGRTFRDVGNGQFETFLEQQTEGELARQLVRLEPGVYRFSADVSPISAMQDMRVGLTCADSEQPITDWQSLDSGPEWQIGAACSQHWLVLTGSAWERRSGFGAIISDMTLDKR